MNKWIALLMTGSWATSDTPLPVRSFWRHYFWMMRNEYLTFDQLNLFKWWVYCMISFAINTKTILHWIVIIFPLHNQRCSRECKLCFKIQLNFGRLSIGGLNTASLISDCILLLIAQRWQHSMWTCPCYCSQIEILHWFKHFFNHF